MNGFNLAPYRKGVVAALGIACQLVAAGLLPPAWQPWGAVVLAAGTAAGVYAVPNRPLPSGAAKDTGQASLAQLWRTSGVLVLLMAATWVATGPAAAHWRPAPDLARPLKLVLIDLNTVWICQGNVIAAYETIQVDGKVASLRADDGRVDMQVHTAAGWLTVPDTSGGENWRRWPLVDLPDLVRLVRTETGVTSVPRTPIEGCPA